MRISRIEIPEGRYFAGPRRDEPSVEDIHALVEDLGEGFGKFKDEHNSKLEKLEASVKDQDREIRTLVIQQAARRTAVDSPASGFMSQSDRNDFAAFARGKFNAAMQTQSNPDGGYLVPETVDAAIGQVARSLSPMRQYANVVQGGLNYSKLVIVEGSSSGWVTETGARPQTDGFKLAMVRPVVGEIYAMPAITQTLLDTASYDVATYLTNDIAEQFAIREGAAFINGSGVNQPRGIATYDFVADASWTWGKVGYMKSGDASGFLAADADTGVSPADCLISLVYSLKPQYRANAVWGMNKSTIEVVRKFKDSEGRFLWADSIVAGQPATLLGYPVVEFTDMDDVGSNKYPIMFGDLNSAYTINDVTPANVLRDPYSLKPYVLFYTTKRVAGGVVMFDAVKFLKIAS